MNWVCDVCNEDTRGLGCGCIKVEEEELTLCPFCSIIRSAARNMGRPVADVHWERHSATVGDDDTPRYLAHVVDVVEGDGRVISCTVEERREGRQHRRQVLAPREEPV